MEQPTNKGARTPMDDTLRAEIDAMITHRILAYHAGLVRQGQIQDIPEDGPLVTHPSSHCNPSAYTLVDRPQEDHPLRQGEPVPERSDEHEHA